MAGALPLASKTRNGLQPKNSFVQDIMSIDLRNRSLLKIYEFNLSWHEFFPFFIYVPRSNDIFYVSGTQSETVESTNVVVKKLLNTTTTHIHFYKKVENGKCCVYIYMDRNNNSPQNVYLCYKNVIGDATAGVTDLSGYTEVAIS